MDNYAELKELFDALPSSKRIAFGAYVGRVLKAKEQSKSINKLVFAKNKKEGGRKCPYCKHKESVRYGRRRGNQWYKCKGCERTFSNRGH